MYECVSANLAKKSLFIFNKIKKVSNKNCPTSHLTGARDPGPSLRTAMTTARLHPEGLLSVVLRSTARRVVTSSWGGSPPTGRGGGKNFSKNPDFSVTGEKVFPNLNFRFRFNHSDEKQNQKKVDLEKRIFLTVGFQKKYQNPGLCVTKIKKP